MKFTLPLAASAALAPMLLLAACGDAEEPAPAETDAMADAVPTDPADAAMPSDPQGFAAMAASSDMYEIEAGKLAQQMGTAQEIKDFGAMMERDHTKSSADLKAAAAETAGVTLPAEMTAKHRADLDALRGAGASFDSVYKTQQLAAHNEALALLQHWSTNGPAGALKEFATKTAPVVETHLGHAEMLP